MIAILLSAVPLAAAALAVRAARALAPGERALVAGAAALCAAMALLAPAAPIHDQWTHFVHLRAALAEPVRLLDAWDRPGFTLLYWAPAALGITAARLTSALSVALAAAATVRTARALGLPWPWTAGALLVVQYDFFGQGASTMTELPFAAALSVALLGWAERRPWLVAAGLGWCGITRPEGVLFAALGAAVLLARERRAGPPALALLPLALWGILGALALRDPLWWLGANPYGGLVAPRVELRQLLESFFYVALWRSQPPVLIVLEAAGVAVALASAPRLRFLLAPLAISFLVLTFVRIGPTDDWRESRYLVAIAPALALLAAAGLEAALAAFPRGAAPALLALAAAGAARELAWNWRDASAGSPVFVSLAYAALLALAALVWVGRERWSPRVGFALLLVIPLACSPPGVYGKLRPERTSWRRGLLSPVRGTDAQAPEQVFLPRATFSRSGPDDRARPVHPGERPGVPADRGRLPAAQP